MTTTESYIIAAFLTLCTLAIWLPSVWQQATSRLDVLLADTDTDLDAAMAAACEREAEVWPACATYPNLGCVCRGALQQRQTCTRKRTGDLTPIPTLAELHAHPRHDALCMEFMDAALGDDEGRWA